MKDMIGKDFQLCRPSDDGIWMWKYSVAVVSIFVFFGVHVSGKENDNDFFESRVRPLLVKHCQECHGAKKQEAGLRLDSRGGWIKGGGSGFGRCRGAAREESPHRGGEI